MISDQRLLLVVILVTWIVPLLSIAMFETLSSPSLAFRYSLLLLLLVISFSNLTSRVGRFWYN